jgi:hypothetical protein
MVSGPNKVFLHTLVDIHIQLLVPHFCTSSLQPFLSLPSLQHGCCNESMEKLTPFSQKLCTSLPSFIHVRMLKGNNNTFIWVVQKIRIILTYFIHGWMSQNYTNLIHLVINIPKLYIELIHPIMDVPQLY